MERPGRLAAYQALGLGLSRTAAALSPHNPRWKRAFSDEAHLVYDRLRLELLVTGADDRPPAGFEVPFASTAIYLAMDYLGARYRAC